MRGRRALNAIASYSEGFIKPPMRAEAQSMVNEIEESLELLRRRL
jgi:hypothetical protein